MRQDHSRRRRCHEGGKQLSKARDCLPRNILGRMKRANRKNDRAPLQGIRLKRLISELAVVVMNHAAVVPHEKSLPSGQLDQ